MRKLWGSKTDHAEVYNIPMTDYQTHNGDAQVETASQTLESATTHTNANIANDLFFHVPDERGSRYNASAFIVQLFDCIFEPLSFIRF